MSNNKWIKLDGKKDPPILTPLLFGKFVTRSGITSFNSVLQENNKTTFEWEFGFLDEIKINNSGKQYTFGKYGSELESTDATHYMIPSSPEEKVEKKIKEDKPKQ